MKHLLFLAVLTTAIPGASNDKYYVRGDNFWDNFTKDAGVDNLRSFLNTGDTGWGECRFLAASRPHRAINKAPHLMALFTSRPTVCE